MFGNLSPSVKNLLGVNNEWRGVQTFTNPYPATSSSATDQKSSPPQVWIGQGYKTASVAGSHPVGIRQYVKPESGTTTARPVWQLDTSVDGKTWVNAIALASGDATLLTTPTTTWKGRFNLEFSNSSTVGTFQNLLFTNPSGSRISIAAKFGATIKAGIEFDNLGNHSYIAGSAGGTFTFYSGASIDGGSSLFQISSIGAYNYGGSFNQGKVTAGQADTTPPAYLTTFGSFAGRGLLVTAASQQLGENDFVVYADPSAANICTGTPSAACSSYGSEGTCTAHALAGCSWSAGSSCSIYSGTDQSTCETQAGCTWGSTNCSVANDTDQSTCENLNMPYGGSCSWDASTCSSQGDQASCEMVTGCTWNDPCSGYSDQSGCEFNGCTWNYTNCGDNFFDESSCNAQSGCSWNGSSCDGQYNTSCTGGSCTGNFCNGTYNDGNCNGTYGSGCTGTALCSNLTDDGSSACAAEAGCTWSSGQEIFLPNLTHVENDTSRFHYFKHIGPSGTVTVSPFSGSGDTLESAISLSAGDGVLLHAFKRTGNCSTFGSQGACEGQPPCVWTPAITCSDYNGDEATCNSYSGQGCSYDSETATCNGAGSAAFCSGTYVVSNKWYKHATI